MLDRIWNEKILKARPDLQQLLTEMLNTVSDPDHVAPDPLANRRRYYRRDVGPSRWLLAVVSYEQEPARIITALANRKDPPSWTP